MKLATFIYRPRLELILQQFVEGQLQQHKGRVLSVLHTTVVSRYPELLTPLIPRLVQLVYASERQRGVGRDTKLR